MIPHNRGGRGGRLLEKLRKRFQRKSLNPDLLREDLLRSLKARFDEASNDLKNCPPDDWEKKVALQKSLAYLAQVLISASRVYQDWGHTYEGEENDAASKEEFKERLDALRETAERLTKDEDKGKDATPPIEGKGDAPIAAEEGCQSGS